MIVPYDKFESWLINKNLKDRTVRNYLYYFNKFKYNILNQETVSQFLSYKQNRNIIARSFLKNLKIFLLENYMELGLTDIVKMQIAEVTFPNMTGRAKKTIVNPLRHEDIPLLEDALESEQLKLQLLISYYCALRLGEMTKINIYSVDWKKWKENTEDMGECRVFGKGDKEGIALIPSFLMKRLVKYIKNIDMVSVEQKLFSKQRNWQLKLANAGIKAGITKFDSEGKVIVGTQVHPHKLRHSYASYLINDKNVNIRVVQEILRHSSIISTQIYTHVNKEHIKKALEKTF